jgi:hypothetical protein
MALSYTMRPKARGLAQHGGPPGWLEGSDPAGCDLLRDGRSMPPALTQGTKAGELVEQPYARVDYIPQPGTKNLATGIL